MKDMAVFGRFSRAYYRLAGMVLATLALGLVMAFADARPAQAAGESWYGTVDWTVNGTQTYNGIVSTENSRVYFEAPVSASQATVKVDLNVTRTYPKPTSGCYLASQTERHLGSDTDAAITVFESTWDGIPYLEVRSHDYYTGLPISVTTKKVYAGTNPDGTSCARTETTTSQGRYHPSAYVLATKNVGTTSRVCAGSSSNMPCSNDINTRLTSAFVAGGPPPTVRWSLAKDVCSGYSNSWDIGNSDTLVLFNRCQSQSLNSRLSVFDDISGTPKACEYAFSLAGDNAGTRLLNRLNKLCDGYKAVLRTQWVGVRWFAYNAALNEGCAVWVVDGASWRPPKIKPATNHSDGQNVAWISAGSTRYLRTATGYQAVTCPV